MLCKCHWIVLYTVHFTAFCLGRPFFPGHGVYTLYRQQLAKNSQPLEKKFKKPGMAKNYFESHCKGNNQRYDDNNQN